MNVQIHLLCPDFSFVGAIANCRQQQSRKQPEGIAAAAGYLSKAKGAVWFVWCDNIAENATDPAVNLLNLTSPRLPEAGVLWGFQILVNFDLSPVNSDLCSNGGGGGGPFWSSTTPPPR